jgi:deoxyadenosine/deoxycytidine kinase
MTSVVVPYNDDFVDDGLVMGPGPPAFWSISGLISAGKSTAADEIGARLGYKVYHELGPRTEELDEFYADMSSNAFVLQMTLQRRRYVQHKQILWENVPAVSDRTIYEDNAFARMLMEQGRMNKFQYRQMSRMLHTDMRQPTLVIHLDVDPEIAYYRMQKRSRPCEKEIPLSYFQDLHKMYERFLEELPKIVPVIRVDYNEFWDWDVLFNAIKDLAKPQPRLNNIKRY